MNEVIALLENVLNIDFIRAILSNPRRKDGIQKVKVRPVEMKGQLFFQLESFTKAQAFHENDDASKARSRIIEYLDQFRQMQIETVREDISVLISKKGKITVKRKKKMTESKAPELSHNRKKRYILEEGKPVPFLIDLGVMTREGRIVHSRMDKFRQINRFLEFIEDILPSLERNRELTIIDFGCGKSYLTFAMYYYLHELCGYSINVTGLDLKEEVIRHCNELTKKYGYDKLRFLAGDIADYEGADQVDMVVTLHACDTATDFALAKAVNWGADVILSVPCCQHELNGQISSKDLAPIMDYGLLKERFAALVTDGLRAKYLEREGYETQVLEFIDMEHTPKNILLRAVKNEKRNEKTEKEIKKCIDFLNVDPTLGRLLADRSGRMEKDIHRHELSGSSSQAKGGTQQKSNSEEGENYK